MQLLLYRESDSEGMYKKSLYRVVGCVYTCMHCQGKVLSIKGSAYMDKVHHFVLNKITKKMFKLKV